MYKPQITISPLYRRDLKVPLPVQNAFSCENKHHLENPVTVSSFQSSNLKSVICSRHKMFDHRVLECLSNTFSLPQKTKNTNLT